MFSNFGILISLKLIFVILVNESSGSGSDVGGGSGDSYSSDENSAEMDSEKHEKRRGISFVDLEKIRVSRDDIEKWYNELFFLETIKGAFAKVCVGQNSQGISEYKI